MCRHDVKYFDCGGLECPQDNDTNDNAYGTCFQCKFHLHSRMIVCACPSRVFMCVCVCVCVRACAVSGERVWVGPSVRLLCRRDNAVPTRMGAEGSQGIERPCGDLLAEGGPIGVLAAGVCANVFVLLPQFFFT
eukprot:GHVU01031936.1.p2 GENE.GHVU01031936.1~~GHVU01031936.1.p2  ORF type:complete len:134 (-),score=10.46 GHVU01031936.1:16-417(-)